jgi:hypothetical protein
VYTLGLFIYSVFEGLSNVRRNVANQFPIEPEVEFPTFQKTPQAIMRLIQDCTADTPDWQSARLQSEQSRIVRMNGLVYPEAQIDLERDTHATFDTVMDALLRFWSIELARAEKFLDSPEWKTGDFGANRPSLREVVNALGNSSEDLNE